MSLAREIHRHASGCRRRDYFFITHRATRLNHRGDSRIDQHLQPVGEREKRVTRRDTSVRSVASSVDRKVAGIDAIDLPHPDSDGRTPRGEQNCVGLHRPTGAPREFEVGQNLFVCRSPRDERPVRGCRKVPVCVLNQESARNLANFARELLEVVRQDQ